MTFHPDEPVRQELIDRFSLPDDLQGEEIQQAIEHVYDDVLSKDPITQRHMFIRMAWHIYNEKEE